MFPAPPIGIGFDIDHTMAIDNKLERIALLRLLEPIRRAGGVVANSLDEETEAIDRLLAWQRSGACTIEEAVARFVRERGVRDDERSYVESFRTIALDLADRLVVPLPGAAQTFAVLRAAGVAVAALSNGWNPLQARKARLAGFTGPVVVSADLQTQKPDRAAFAALLATLGLPAERVWYVGDDPVLDVAGAPAAGLRAVWLDAERRPFPAGATPPDLTIGSLPELPAALCIEGAAAVAPHEPV